MFNRSKQSLVKSAARALSAKLHAPAQALRALATTTNNNNNNKNINNTSNDGMTKSMRKNQNPDCQDPSTSSGKRGQVVEGTADRSGPAQGQCVVTNRGLERGDNIPIDVVCEDVNANNGKMSSNASVNSSSHSSSSHQSNAKKMSQTGSMNMSGTSKPFSTAAHNNDSGHESGIGGQYERPHDHYASSKMKNASSSSTDASRLKSESSGKGMKGAKGTQAPEAFIHNPDGSYSYSYQGFSVSERTPEGARVTRGEKVNQNPLKVEEYVYDRDMSLKSTAKKTYPSLQDYNYDSLMGGKDLNQPLDGHLLKDSSSSSAPASGSAKKNVDMGSKTGQNTTQTASRSGIGSGKTMNEPRKPTDKSPLASGRSQRDFAIDSTSSNKPILTQREKPRMGDSSGKDGRGVILPEETSLNFESEEIKNYEVSPAKKHPAKVTELPKKDFNNPANEQKLNLRRAWDDYCKRHDITNEKRMDWSIKSSEEFAEAHLPLEELKDKRKQELREQKKWDSEPVTGASFGIKLNETKGKGPGKPSDGGLGGGSAGSFQRRAHRGIHTTVASRRRSPYRQFSTSSGSSKDSRGAHTAETTAKGQNRATGRGSGMGMTQGQEAFAEASSLNPPGSFPQPIGLMDSSPKMDLQGDADTFSPANLRVGVAGSAPEPSYFEKTRRVRAMTKEAQRAVDQESREAAGVPGRRVNTPPTYVNEWVSQEEPLEEWTNVGRDPNNVTGSTSLSNPQFTVQNRSHPYSTSSRGYSQQSTSHRYDRDHDRDHDMDETPSDRNFSSNINALEHNLPLNYFFDGNPIPDSDFEEANMQFQTHRRGMTPSLDQITYYGAARDHWDSNRGLQQQQRETRNRNERSSSSYPSYTSSYNARRDNDRHEADRYANNNMTTLSAENRAYSVRDGDDAFAPGLDFDPYDRLEPNPSQDSIRRMKLRDEASQRLRRYHDLKGQGVNFDRSTSTSRDVRNYMNQYELDELDQYDQLQGRGGYSKESYAAMGDYGSSRRPTEFTEVYEDESIHESQLQGQGRRQQSPRSTSTSNASRTRVDRARADRDHGYGYVKEKDIQALRPDLRKYDQNERSRMYNQFNQFEQFAANVQSHYPGPDCSSGDVGAGGARANERVDVAAIINKDHQTEAYRQHDRQTSTGSRWGTSSASMDSQARKSLAENSNYGQQYGQGQNRSSSSSMRSPRGGNRKPSVGDAAWGMVQDQSWNQSQNMFEKDRQAQMYNNRNSHNSHNNPVQVNSKRPQHSESVNYGGNKSDSARDDQNHYMSRLENQRDMQRLEKIEESERQMNEEGGPWAEPVCNAVGDTSTAACSIKSIPKGGMINVNNGETKMMPNHAFIEQHDRHYSVPDHAHSAASRSGDAANGYRNTSSSSSSSRNNTNTNTNTTNNNRIGGISSISSARQGQNQNRQQESHSSHAPNRFLGLGDVLHTTSSSSTSNLHGKTGSSNLHGSSRQVHSSAGPGMGGRGYEMNENFDDLEDHPDRQARYESEHRGTSATRSHADMRATSNTNSTNNDNFNSQSTRTPAGVKQNIIPSSSKSSSHANKESQNQDHMIKTSANEARKRAEKGPDGSEEYYAEYKNQRSSKMWEESGVAWDRDNNYKSNKEALADKQAPRSTKTSGGLGRPSSPATNANRNVFTNSKRTFATSRPPKSPLDHEFLSPETKEAILDAKLSIKESASDAWQKTKTVADKVIDDIEHGAGQVKAGTEKLRHNVEEAAKNASRDLRHNAENVKDSVEGAVKRTSHDLRHNAENVKDSVEGVAKKASRDLRHNAENVKDRVEDSAKNMTRDLRRNFGTKAENLKDNVEEVIDYASQDLRRDFKEAVRGAGQAVSNVKSSVKKGIEAVEQDVEDGKWLMDHGIAPTRENAEKYIYNRGQEYEMNQQRSKNTNSNPRSWKDESDELNSRSYRTAGSNTDANFSQNVAELERRIPEDPFFDGNPLHERDTSTTNPSSSSYQSEKNALKTQEYSRQRQASRSHESLAEMTKRKQHEVEEDVEALTQKTKAAIDTTKEVLSTVGAVGSVVGSVVGAGVNTASKTIGKAIDTAAETLDAAVRDEHGRVKGAAKFEELEEKLADRIDEFPDGNPLPLEADTIEADQRFVRSSKTPEARAREEMSRPKQDPLAMKVTKSLTSNSTIRSVNQFADKLSKPVARGLDEIDRNLEESPIQKNKPIASSPTRKTETVHTNGTLDEINNETNQELFAPRPIDTPLAALEREQREKMEQQNLEQQRRERGTHSKHVTSTTNNSNMSHVKGKDINCHTAETYSTAKQNVGLTNNLLSKEESLYPWDNVNADKILAENVGKSQQLDSVLGDMVEDMATLAKESGYTAKDYAGTVFERRRDNEIRRLKEKRIEEDKKYAIEFAKKHPHVGETHAIPLDSTNLPLTKEHPYYMKENYELDSAVFHTDGGPYTKGRTYEYFTGVGVTFPYNTGKKSMQQGHAKLSDKSPNEYISHDKPTGEIRSIGDIHSNASTKSKMNTQNLGMNRLGQQSKTTYESTSGFSTTRNSMNSEDPISKYLGDKSVQKTNETSKMRRSPYVSSVIKQMGAIGLSMSSKDLKQQQKREHDIEHNIEERKSDAKKH